MWIWDLKWRQPLVGREETWLPNLLQDLNGVSLVEGSLDKWLWHPSPDHVYSVNSSYSFLQVDEV